MFSVSDAFLRVRNDTTGKMVKVEQLTNMTLSLIGSTKDGREDGNLFANDVLTNRSYVLTVQAKACLTPDGARDAGQVLLHQKAVSATPTCHISVRDAMGQGIEGDFLILREEKRDTSEGSEWLWKLQSALKPTEKAYVALETILVRDETQQFITNLTLAEEESATLTIVTSPATATNTRAFFMVADESVARAEMADETHCTVTGVSHGATTLTFRALGGVTTQIALEVTQ